MFHFLYKVRVFPLLLVFLSSNAFSNMHENNNQYFTFSTEYGYKIHDNQKNSQGDSSIGISVGYQLNSDTGVFGRYAIGSKGQEVTSLGVSKHFNINDDWFWSGSVGTAMLDEPLDRLKPELGILINRKIDERFSLNFGANIILDQKFDHISNAQFVVSTSFKFGAGYAKNIEKYGLHDSASNLASDDTTSGENLHSSDNTVKKRNVLNKTSINFDFSSSEVNSDPNVDLNGNIILIELVGHTDSIGRKEYNQRLGLERASKVKKWFVDKGIDPQKIKISSKGESEPVSSNQNSQGRKENRRVDIYICN